MRWALVITGVLTILLALVIWGGTATGGSLFVLGVSLFIGMLSAFVALAGWLFFSRLPAGAQVLIARDPSARQIVAILVLIGVGLYAGGFFWDEVWHRVYGGFRDDFLWPPHFLIYSSLAMLAGFAGYGLRFVVAGRGSLRERIRTEPMIGLMGLVAAFLVVSVPSDLVWHQIYGKDITAWSLPHLTLFGGSAVVALTGVGLQLSIVPSQPWRGLRGLSAREWVAIGLLALAVVTIVQIGTTEWEGIPDPDVVGRIDLPNAFWDRPEWLYPVVVVAIGLFYGTLTLHALQRAGAATLVGALVLGFRMISLAAVAPEAAAYGLGATTHLLLLAPFVTLDVWYGVRRSQPNSATTLIGGNLLAVAVSLLAGLPLIGAAMAYPRVNANTLPGMVIVSVGMGLAAGWAGARVGDWLGALDRRPESVPIDRRVIRLSLGAAALAIALVLAIILTAKPPVA